MRMGLQIIPIASFLLIIVLCSITFAIALSLGHIRAFFSYISDTGTLVPEMCIFALGMSLAMVLFLLMVYVRYKQVETFVSQLDPPSRYWMKMNIVGYIFGIMAAIGLTVIGSFQETNQIFVHIFGSVLSFLGGAIYIIIQGFITLKMSPLYVSVTMAYVRIGMGVTCVILYLICHITGVVALNQYKGEMAYITKWKPTDGGWGFRVTSVTTEWIMATIFQLFFLSFVGEFTNNVTYVSPQFLIHERGNQPPRVSTFSAFIEKAEESEMPKDEIKEA